MTGHRVEVVMQGRELRTRRVATSEVKPIHVHPSHRRQSIADEFAQHVWGQDWSHHTRPSVRVCHLGTSPRDLLQQARRTGSTRQGRPKATYCTDYRRAVSDAVLPSRKRMLSTHSGINITLQFQIEIHARRSALPLFHALC